MTDITVYTFGANEWPTPDPSPFCIKLLGYLQLAQIPFDHRSGFEYIRQAPKGKMPYIQTESGPMGDSALIIDWLKQRFGDPLNEGLSAEQQALTHTVGKMLSENTYWAIVYTRWMDEDNWNQITRPAFFGEMNPLIRSILPPILRRGVRRQLQSHGLGRHTAEEIYEIGIKDMTALGSLLGGGEYFFDDRPRELDLHAYATLSGIVGVPHSSPLRDFVASHQALADFHQRMDKLLLQGMVSRWAR